jgi:predicted DsbA family dithiol-disulfide isomerase
MRFISETESGALRAHLDGELEGPVTLDHVTADVVEISEFPDLAAQYQVRGVPKIVVNDTVELVGAQPEAAFVDAMLRAAA